MMAGWIDTVRYIFLNENSSFLTGRAAKLGKYILNGETQKLGHIIDYNIFYRRCLYFYIN